MRDTFSRIRGILTRSFAVRPLDALSAYIGTLSKGDAAIVGVLGGLVMISSVGSLYALEQSVLVSEPAYGGTLTQGIIGSPRFVNPLLALSDADRDMVMLTYAGLMKEDGAGTLIPVLAESYSISEDGRQYTFVLRKDAVFSDGTPVTAEDVLFTIEKAQDPALKSPEYANWSGVAVQVVDTHTVKFTLAKPYAPFLENTTLGILPAHLWKDVPVEQFPFSTLNTEPVGAGPFVVNDIGRNASGIIKEYELTANKKYVLGRPYLSRLDFLFYSDQEDLAEALSDGTVESAYGIPSETSIQAPYSRVFGVFFNPNENAALARIEVRKALSIAIDRNHIVNDILGGYASPLMGPVPPGSGVPEIPLPVVETRIQEATDILERNGWTYDEEQFAWTNEKANLTLSMTIKTSNVPELKAVASAVKEDWETLGVPVAIELYEPGDLTQNVIRPRQYDALLFGMVVGRDRDLYAFWDSAERNDPGLNIAMYANKSVDELLEKARAESDPDAVTEDLAKINELVAAEYPAAFTHAPDFLFAVPAELSGVELPQITAPSDRFASVSTWYLRTE